MATDRPFDVDKRDFLDKLNDLYNVGNPRVLVNPDDPESAGTDVIVNRQMKFNDAGRTADVRASVTISFAAECITDGWGMFIHVITGTATVQAGAGVGALFADGTASKTINAGNAAYISSDGTGFRIFRMTAT